MDSCIKMLTMVVVYCCIPKFNTVRKIVKKELLLPVFGVAPLEIGASVAVEPCVGRGILGQSCEDVAAFLGEFGVPSLDLDAALLPAVL